MGQEDGKKWAAAAHSQPTIPKSDRLLGRPASDRAWLLAHDRDPLPAACLAQFAALCQRRAAGEPVAYLTGVKEFYGLPLAIDARVLDPRPDTEVLVDWALEVLAGRAAPRVLDLGTGSGAIALALQHQRPDAQVLAVDASADALAVAQANARRLALPVQFMQSDWLEGVRGSFDLIVANPPYIAADDPHLPTLRHEPSQALVSGAQGLDDLRRIVADAPRHLAPGGWLLLEHGWDQAAAVRELLHAQGLVQVQSRRDLGSHERCSGAQKAARAQGSQAGPPCA
ncbi:MAG: peptide chain release factor N(5)-glutamine methyltransferase [Burkholderiaceae bacterium]|nr:peptide chain release factor N(5)-glutamine methyltransferase [Burkholderiaceae bacterium]